VVDLLAKVNEPLAQGVTFRNDVVEGPGGREVLCEDPIGNVVGLFEPAAAG
jgi:hypothetical protein